MSLSSAAALDPTTAIIMVALAGRGVDSADRLRLVRGGGEVDEGLLAVQPRCDAVSYPTRPFEHIRISTPGPRSVRAQWREKRQ